MKTGSKIVDVAHQVCHASLELRAILRKARFNINFCIEVEKGKELIWALIPNQDAKFDIYYRDLANARVDQWTRVHLCPMDVRLEIYNGQYLQKFAKAIDHYNQNPGNPGFETKTGIHELQEYKVDKKG